MLTQVDVDSDNSFTVPIVGVTPKDSLLIRQINGLSPPGLNLFIGDYAISGGSYQGRRVGTRNIVILMELNPNPALGETISSLRERLYKAFLDPLVEADYVKMVLHLDDGRLLEAVGYAETFETDIFSVDTFVQISMICPDPYLKDTVPRVLATATGWTQVPFTYTGSAETGFEAEIKVAMDTPRLILANNTVTDDVNSPLYPRGRLIVDRAFVAGDLVTVNTTRGSRKIMLTPISTGVPVSILASMTSTSQWIELHSQRNTMRIYGSTPASLPAIIQKLTFVQTYWGI